MDKEFAFHNSQLIEYRSPFGAVTIGTEVEIKILANKFSDVYLKVLDFYDKEYIFKLEWYKDNELGSIYKGHINTNNLLGANKYFFIIKINEIEFYYGNNEEGLGGEGSIYYNNPIPYQLTVYERQSVPSWLKEGIMYQIFVDRFYNGNKNGEINNTKENSFIYGSWKDEPMYIKDKEEKIIRWDFYGGNLLGVIKKIPYLKDLGVTILYFNPIFKSSSCHKYDTGDYSEIDEMFGDEKIFKELCDEASRYGIRVILDGVFSHTGSDSKYFNKLGSYEEVGAFQSKDSKYYSWYKFYDYPDSYESWWGFDNQPNVDELNPSYIKYIITDEDSIISKWTNLGVSGWRLDVADELPDRFIEILKEKLKDIKEESILIGEVWEDASNKVSYSQKRRYFFGKELDSVTNYPLRESIIRYVKGQYRSVDFIRHIYSLYENYPVENYYSTMNLLGNHDTERILTVLNSDNNILELALVIQMSLPGCPLIYYGDEAGVVGGRDPSNRKTYPWGRENKEVHEIYRRLIEFRRCNPPLLRGDFEFIDNREDILIIKRTLNEKSIIVLANNTKITKIINLKQAMDCKFIKCNKLKDLNNSDINLCSIRVMKQGYRILIEV